MKSKGEKTYFRPFDHLCFFSSEAQSLTNDAAIDSGCTRRSSIADPHTPMKTASKAHDECTRLDMFSRRAQSIVKRVENIISRCEGSMRCGNIGRTNQSDGCVKAQPNPSAPSKEEIAMYEMFALLYSSRFGSFFASHFEVLLSNQASVITTPEFPQDWDTAGYRLCGTYRPGTVGRSYLAIRSPPHKDTPSILKKGSTRFKGRVYSRDTLQNMYGSHYVLKVMSFVLRKEIVDEIVSEQQALVRTPCDHILRITDVLNDEYKENTIIVTKFHPNGNVAPYAGKLDAFPDKLLRIMNDVALGLHFLSIHGIYHHNLKLENVLEMPDDRYCIADAGFSSLFTTQCPEALVFNGELACLAPEVFDEHGPYAGDSVGISDDSLDKVDIWGFGVFMYCIAYGEEPFNITECDYYTVKQCLLNDVPCFPAKPWPFAADLAHAISLCLAKDPTARPSIEELLCMPIFAECGCTSMSQDSAPVTRGVPSFIRPHGSDMAAHVSGMHSNTHAYQGGRYTVDRILGRGVVSEALLVHLRRNPRKHFVLKLVGKSIHKLLHEGAGASCVERILHQLALSQKISHPNLVQYLSVVDNKKGSCFVVQEYVEGESLKTMPPLGSANTTAPTGRRSEHPCTRSGVDAITDDTTVTLQKLLADVLCGLVCLHDNDIPHLNIRPSNILYDKVSNSFKLVDYGPLFLTIEEILQLGAQGRPCYSLPNWITGAKSVDPFAVDTLCIGLLAASVVPKVFLEVWPQLCCFEGTTPLLVDSVLESISSPGESLPRDLLNFIRDALYNRKTARQLLQHPYFEGKLAASAGESQKVKLSSVDVSQAVLSKPRDCDELCMLEALGWASSPANVLLSPLVADLCDISTGTDKQITINFTGSKFQCSLCHGKISLALYRCPQCEDSIWCGKCALNDHHKPGHNLVPFLVDIIEHRKDGSSCAVLCHLSSISDPHALETIEMQANFPVGLLSGAAANKRSLERSLAHNVAFGTPTNAQYDPNKQILDTSSATLLQESFEESFLNVSTQASSFSKRFSSFATPDLQFITLQNPKNSFSLNTRYSFAESGASAGNPNCKVRSMLMPPHVASPVPEKSFLRAKNALKLATLPKAEEVADITWQEELERCRRTSQSDLLLFNYEFTEVPVEVYTPLPVHVVYLDLSHNFLTSLPDELRYMVHLRKLVVSFNKLTTLPESFGSLGQLELIDASHNAIERLPDSFVLLFNLHFIALDYNNFSEIPRCILDILPSRNGSGRLRQHSFDVRSTQHSALSTTTLSNADLEDLDAPVLSVLYLAANDRITTWPEIDRFKRFESLTIALDNEPTLYRSYISKSLEEELPNITINWNKIYPDEIIPRLFCGSLRSAQSQMVYRKLDISYVLTMGRRLVPVPPEEGKHKVIVIDDIPGADISYSFQESVDFIDESQASCKGCLVHCFSGLSRSATTVIAYLMIRKKMRLDEAYMVTKKGRPSIFPNKGFFNQLIELDKKLFPNPDRQLDIMMLERPP